ncbi:MAG: hypothetical protein ABI824_17220 [Acidobacteriota bacterium]
MADFRKLFYGLGVAALFAGLSAPAFAQSQALVCTASAAVPPIVRSEGYAELMGDIVLDCTGGNPTTAGAVVPAINITILLSTNVTSKLLSGVFNEALLIIDEPNSALGATLGQADPGNRTQRPLLACGDQTGSSGAPDTSLSGPNVCNIVAPQDSRNTYDGTRNANYSATDGSTACDSHVIVAAVGNTPAVLAPAPNSFGCGRPNVYQGRQGVAQPGFNSPNSVVWLNIPFDPPGDNRHRILRFTNIRANANFFFGANLAQFATSQIFADIAINGNNLLSLPNPHQLVAYVQRGLLAPIVTSKTDFIQCLNRFLSDLPLSASAKSDHTRPDNYNASVGSLGQAASITFQEGFASSWKPKGFEDILLNGFYGGNRWNYKDGSGGSLYGSSASVSTPTSLARQNVPGALYNTESGFNSPAPTPPWVTPGNGSIGTTDSQNPPLGIGNVAVSTSPNVITNSTGISGAGIATQGTRLVITVNAVAGSTVSTPGAIWLVRQGTTSVFSNGIVTGIAVRVNGALADGSGGSTAGTATGASPAGCSTSSPACWVTATSTTGNVVYEVLFDDPSSYEETRIPLGVSYVQDLSKNLPDPTTNGQVAGGFAPFYATGADLPSSSLPVPRFITGTAPVSFYSVNKCACNILFPFVASTGVNGFDTALAIANTSADPTNTAQGPGFTALAQAGSLQFWYFNTGSGQAAVASQCPNSTTTGACPGNITVPAGGLYVYQLSQGNAGATGVSAGLKNSAASFVGYMIVRTDFQFCHAFAYISATGAGPSNPGISVGYIGLIMDKGSELSRTIQTNSDNLGR